MDKKDIGILVVDDEPGIREMLQISLNDWGYNNVRTAEDGIDALEKLVQSDAKILIVDNSMRRMGGPEFLQTLKTQRRLDNYAVIMMSAYCEQKDADVLNQVFEGKPYRLLNKPYNIEDVQKQLDEIYKTLT